MRGPAGKLVPRNSQAREPCGGPANDHGQGEAQPTVSPAMGSSKQATWTASVKKAPAQRMEEVEDDTAAQRRMIQRPKDWRTRPMVVRAVIALWNLLTDTSWEMRQPPIEAAVEEERSQARNPGPAIHGSRQIQRWEPGKLLSELREKNACFTGSSEGVHRPCVDFSGSPTVSCSKNQSVLLFLLWCFWEMQDHIHPWKLCSLPLSRWWESLSSGYSSRWQDADWDQPWGKPHFSL